jgi:aspartate aminotransferase-like enzyme
MLAEHGFASVAANGFEAPGVVVSYSDDPQLVSRFAEAGVQVAAGVPLMCDEGEAFKTFRIGLFGLDKLHDVERSLANLEKALRRAEASQEN